MKTKNESIWLEVLMPSKNALEHCPHYKVKTAEYQLYLEAFFIN